ncbi:MAG: hypothetical protein EA366_10920 [Spirulina sp. DLM2.Bin59]|nr:MAG: hypothetical protein EA366_10920 [Spirulina sp. DLM2.Bin59]
MKVKSLLTLILVATFGIGFVGCAAPETTEPEVAPTEEMDTDAEMVPDGVDTDTEAAPEGAETEGMTGDTEEEPEAAE